MSCSWRATGETRAGVATGAVAGFEVTEHSAAESRDSSADLDPEEETVVVEIEGLRPGTLSL